MAEKEETDKLDEQSQTNLLVLPELGSQARLLAERKLVQKLDTRLLPTVLIIYIANYVDRAGITTARLQGAQKDLHLTDVQYAMVIAILFVSYCPGQIPSNMILNRMARPSWYIGGCAVLWGITSALTGITTNFGGIMACRVFIGLPEAAFYPGAIYLLSRWYTKKELAFRTAILYLGSMISLAFGNLIAAGILATMDGALGIRSWRWLFFIEGSVTITIGLFSIWVLPDYPNNTPWITGRERRLAQARLAEDAGEADQDNAEDSPMAGFLMAIKDPIVLLFAFMCMVLVVGLNFIQFFPTLAQTVGFRGTIVTLLIAAPPWVVAAVICCLTAWHADKTGERFFHISVWPWVASLGCIVALSTMSTAGRYVSLFLLACGTCGAGLNLVWLANTIPRPPAKRAAAIGIVNGLANIGNIIGPFTWKSIWGPKYHQPLVICLSSLMLSTFLSFVIRQMLIRKNRQLDASEQSALQEADQTRVAEAARLEGITFEEAMKRRKGFRYLY